MRRIRNTRTREKKTTKEDKRKVHPPQIMTTALIPIQIVKVK